MVAPASPARSPKGKANNEKLSLNSTKKTGSGKKRSNKKKAQPTSLSPTRPNVALGEPGTTPLEAVEHRQRHKPQRQHHERPEEEVEEMVKEEKPALRRVLEDCRDRAADVREKIEALALRAAEEAEEVGVCAALYKTLCVNLPCMTACNTPSNA